MASPIPASGTKRVRPGRRLSLRQVVELQDIAFQAAQGLIADFKETSEKEERARVASAISNLAKGWVSLQDSKREILGKPRAGVRKHPVEKEPKRNSAGDKWRILDLEPEPGVQAQGPLVATGPTVKPKSSTQPGGLEGQDQTSAQDAEVIREKRADPEEISLAPRAQDGEPLSEDQ